MKLRLRGEQSGLPQQSNKGLLGPPVHDSESNHFLEIGETLTRGNDFAPSAASAPVQ